MVKNPNWQEVNQPAIYKCGRRFELRTAKNKSSWRSGRDLNSGPPNNKSSALTTRPCRLLIHTLQCKKSKCPNFHLEFFTSQQNRSSQVKFLKNNVRETQTKHSTKACLNTLIKAIKNVTI